jgi:hypothetical protein
MKTERTQVTNNLQVWAIPRSAWHMEQYPKDLPFSYEILRGSPYTNGSVLVHEEEITMLVPAGIDLVERAVLTLKDQMDLIQKDADERIQEIQEQINSMLLISHVSDLRSEGVI